MPNVTGRVLALAIQAVDFKISSLERSIDSLPPGSGGELEDLLLTYTNAAETLKQAYQEALVESHNLPSYEKLVRSEG